MSDVPPISGSLDTSRLMDESAFADAAWDCEQALRAMLGQNINRPVLLEHLRRAFVQGMQRQGRVSQEKQESAR